jgi:ABC-type multidrug transport system fused ATPase/permease subunit
LVKPILWKNVFDGLVTNVDMWSYFYWALSVSIIAYICSRFGDVSIVIAEAKIIRNLKNSILESLLGKSMQFYTEHSSGGLVAKSKRFASVSEQVIDEVVLSIIRSVLLIFYLLIFTSITIPKLMPVFVVWVIVFMAMVLIMSRIRLKYDLETSNADSVTIGFISDTLLSVTVLRIFSATPAQFLKFLGITDDEAYKRKRSWFLGNIQWGMQSLLVLVLEFVCMYVVLHDIENKIYLVGMAALIQSYIASLTGYMWGLGRSLIKVRTAFADAYEMAVLLDEPTEEPLVETDFLTVPHYGISLENINFSYGDGRSVLHNLKYTFQEGNSYGIVGETGSGKSTIMKLLMRFYNPEQGQITIGGIDISLIDKNQLRNLISFVPQNPVFPSITIREVIRLGRPDATEEEVNSAARRACCDFIWTKPLQMDTLIGERGVKLSGGESQRLAIAAAILKDAPIVVMDEPTSALDAETEHSIQEALHSHFKGKTMIVIAHRLSTVAVLGEILLLEKGLITHHAPHEELLQKSEVYTRMWLLQTHPQIMIYE